MKFLIICFEDSDGFFEDESASAYIAVLEPFLRTNEIQMQKFIDSIMVNTAEMKPCEVSKLVRTLEVKMLANLN